MKKFAFIATLFLALSLTASCSALNAVKDILGTEDLVVTSLDNVAEGVNAKAVNLDSLPEDVRKLIPEGMEVAVIDRADLVDPEAAHIPLMSEFGDTAIATAFDASMHIGKTFFPALAGWEALLAVFFRRKRSHYSNAFKAIWPSDKNVDIGGSVAALGSALGMTHSSKGTEKTWDGETAKKA